jgi:hypothetical protein
MKTLEPSPGPSLYKPIVCFRQENREEEGRTHVCTLLPDIDLEGAVEALLDRAQTHRVRAEATLFGSTLVVEPGMSHEQVMRDFVTARRRSQP